MSNTSASLEPLLAMESKKKGVPPIKRAKWHLGELWNKPKDKLCEFCGKQLYNSEKLFDLQIVAVPCYSLLRFNVELACLYKVPQ